MGKKLEKLKKAGRDIGKGFREVQNVAAKIKAETGLTEGLGDYILGERSPAPRKKKGKSDVETGRVIFNINIEDHLLGTDRDKKKKKG